MIREQLPGLWMVLRLSSAVEVAFRAVEIVSVDLADGARVHVP